MDYTNHRYMCKIFSTFGREVGNVCNQRNIFNGCTQDQCTDMGIVLASSMKATIHLGPDFLTNSEIYKNTKFEKIWSVFNSTQKLRNEHSEEILNMECLEYSSPSWTRSILANNQAKVKVCVYADSVLCVGQVKDISGATERWPGQVENLKMYSSYQDEVGLDREPIEFEWNIFPEFSSLSLLREIQNDLESKNIKPEDFKDRTIFMSMKSRITPWSFDQDIGRFWVQDRKRTGMAIPMIKKRHWNCTANKMVHPFKETDHSVFKSTSAWSRRILKQREAMEIL